MKYRVITVPKDIEADRKLYFNVAESRELIEILLKEDEFLFLEKEGILTLINNIANIYIADFEHDFIRGDEKLKKTLEALELKRKSMQDSNLMKQLVILFKEAINRKIGVYFYFNS